ncbi:MAG: LysM peptidoglycan-binding domain-containing protein [Chloroflexota bacterium]
MLFRSILLAFLLLLPAEANASGYMVRPGDTLSAIAFRQGVPITSLIAANRITNANYIRAGMVLILPAPGQSVVAHYVYYRVRWGDTLLGIAGRYGMFVQTIRNLNPRLGVYPLAGQWLRVCYPCGGRTTAAAPAPQAQAPSAAPGAFYVVRPGDTLIGIASRYGVNTASLLAVNGLSNPNFIVIGARLRIPSAGTAPVPGIVQQGYDPVGARQLIVNDAAAYGVDSSLPLAIAWQESGFNQSMVSATGAIGVMQVEPYTGTVIDQLLHRPFNLYNETDNIQAGTFWLAYLLEYYRGDESSAIAAYYQGSRSIAEHGLFLDTIQYVRNVAALQTRFGG